MKKIFFLFIFLLAPHLLQAADCEDAMAEPESHCMGKTCSERIYNIGHIMDKCGGVENAIAVATARAPNSPVVLWFSPDKQYIITRPIEIRVNAVHLIGGSESTIIKCALSTHGTCIGFRSPAEDRAGYGFKVERIKMEWSQTARPQNPELVIGLEFKIARMITVRDVSFHNFPGTSMHLNTVQESFFDNISFISAGANLRSNIAMLFDEPQGTIGGNNISANRISRVLIKNYNYGIKFISVFADNATSIVDSEFINNKYYSVEIKQGINIRVKRSKFSNIHAFTLPFGDTRPQSWIDSGKYSGGEIEIEGRSDVIVADNEFTFGNSLRRYPVFYNLDRPTIWPSRLQLRNNILKGSSGSKMVYSKNPPPFILQDMQ